MNEASTDKTAGPGRMRGIKHVVAGALLAVAAGAAMTTWAAAPGDVGHHHGHGGVGAGWFQGDPERVDRRVDRVLASVNATDAQRTQVKQIVRAAAADLKAQRDTGRNLRAESARLFTAPTVDANAVEALRQQRVAQFDQRSRRVSQALVEISRVLTPEQRVKLAENLKRHAEHRGRQGPRGADAPVDAPKQ